MRMRRRRTYTSKDVRQLGPRKKPLERAGKTDRLSRPKRKSSR